MACSFLETNRLILRPFTEEDQDDYAAIVMQDEVARWLGGTTGYDRNRARQDIDRRIISQQARGFSEFAVCLRVSRKLIGFCGFAIYDDALAIGLEFSYAFDPTCWGQGLAFEATQRMLAYGGSELGFGSVHAITKQGNTRSQNLLKKLGFQRQSSHPAEPDAVIFRFDWQSSRR